MKTDRREFLKTSAASIAGVALFPACAANDTPIFRISLAEWSVNKLIFGGTMDHLDFAIEAKKHGIEAIEYVNQFFMDKAQDRGYLGEMKARAEGEGVTSLLIMCDNEGILGHPEEKERIQAVENHKKWVEAAAFLGCHTVRVNGYSTGRAGGTSNFDDDMKLVADGLRRLCEFASDYEMSIVIENHGGLSSNGKWLAGVIEMADHSLAGTLPDFGNFKIDDFESYDSYRGVKELMPFATGVSVKPRVWDDNQNQSDLDYERMMRIVLDAGFRGYCGIEYGPDGRQWEGIAEVQQALLETRESLQVSYS